MSYEQKDGSGALFKADKETPQHPDYKGSVKVGGMDYWLSAWIKEAKSGQKFMSLSAQPKQAPKLKPEAKPDPHAEFDDAIPF